MMNVKCTGSRPKQLPIEPQSLLPSADNAAQAAKQPIAKAQAAANRAETAAMRAEKSSRGSLCLYGFGKTVSASQEEKSREEGRNGKFVNLTSHLSLISLIPIEGVAIFATPSFLCARASKAEAAARNAEAAAADSKAAADRAEAAADRAEAAAAKAEACLMKRMRK